MYREGETIKELRSQLTCLRADLYQGCATMTLQSLERLCRKIHVTESRLYSFRGGRYGREGQ